MLGLVRARGAAAAARQLAQGRSAAVGARSALGSQFAARAFSTIPLLTTKHAATGATKSADNSSTSVPLTCLADTAADVNPHNALAQTIFDSCGGTVAIEIPRHQQTTNAVSMSREGLVFEFSFMWVLSAYQHVFIGLLRNSFYTFRPIIILFVFGQILKMAFFAMGAPMLLSFYSIWMFEVFYGLLQCALSFIFISQYYNNLCFSPLGGRAGPAVRRLAARAKSSTLAARARRALQWGMLKA